MPYYRFVAYTSNANAEDLGSMEFRDDVEALAFGNQVIRDLIGTRAEHYYGWPLHIAEGERALPSIPANRGGHRRTRWTRSLSSSGRLMEKPHASRIRLRMRRCTKPKSSCASTAVI